jgi:hypothetical protein
MYGMTDDLVAEREDNKVLRAMIKRLLVYAPADVREMAIETLKAKNLLPDGVE